MVRHSTRSRQRPRWLAAAVVTVMAAPGERARLLALEFLRHSIADTDGRDREIAGREALSHRHQVRLEVVELACEPLSGAAESIDHLIGDEEDAVLVAEVADRRPVFGWGLGDSIGGGDGFGDEKGEIGNQKSEI